MACTGVEFCKLAIVETKGRAAALINELEARLPEYKLPLAIHVNGCPNSCARFQIADIGLRMRRFFPLKLIGTTLFTATPPSWSTSAYRDGGRSIQQLGHCMAVSRSMSSSRAFSGMRTMSASSQAFSSAWCDFRKFRASSVTLACSE